MVKIKLEGRSMLYGVAGQGVMPRFAESLCGWIVVSGRVCSWGMSVEAGAVGDAEHD